MAMSEPNQAGAKFAPEVRLSAAIMTHPARIDLAEELVRRHPDIPFEIALDPLPDSPGGTLGTSRVAWSRVAPDATHHLVIQDDVELDPHFVQLAVDAIRRLPHHALALFTEWGSRTSHAVRLAALGGACWAEVVDIYIPTQALILPAEAARAFDHFAAREFPPDTEDDVALLRFTRASGIPAVVTVPNIVQHRDLGSIAGNETHGLRHSVCWSDGDRVSLVGPVLDTLLYVPYYSWVTTNAHCQYRMTPSDEWTKLPAREFVLSSMSGEHELAELLAEAMSLIASRSSIVQRVPTPIMERILLTAVALGLTARTAGVAWSPDLLTTGWADRALETFAPGSLRCLVPETVLTDISGDLRPAVDFAVRAGLSGEPGRRSNTRSPNYDLRPVSPTGPAPATRE
jgi:hypothetical protein